MGGAMHYLSQGLKDRNLAGLVAFGCYSVYFALADLWEAEIQSLDMIKTVLPALAEPMDMDTFMIRWTGHSGRH